MSRKIGTIEGCHGGLLVNVVDGKYFWAISTYYNYENWEEIPYDLYSKLIEFDSVVEKRGGRSPEES